MSAWDEIVESLSDEYLRWRYPSSVPTEDLGFAQDAVDTSSAGSPEDMDEDCVEYTVNTFDIFTVEKEITVKRKQSSTSVVLDLMQHGYLAKSPAEPTVAISMRTLELLYRLRQRKASFSIEAFAKVICDYYQV